MESRKSKGGAEKTGIKKREALLTDAAKCAKLFRKNEFAISKFKSKSN